jgi:hypothetical protein
MAWLNSELPTKANVLQLNREPVRTKVLLVADIKQTPVCLSHQR